MTADTEHGSPLHGVRVLELGSLIAGPFAGRLLAEFGAEVIKVEDPARPDPMREWGQARKDGNALWWAVQSRNKKLITLDLDSERGRELLLQLVEGADVLVENFRPGTLERWGLGPEVLWQRNSRLVIARVSGFGQTGSNARRAGYASVAEAMSGMRYLNGFPGELPPRTGLSLGDSLAGMFAFQGILMALYWRDARGGDSGQVIDVSLVESCFAMLESVVPEYAATGAVRGPSGTRLDGLAPSNLFRTSDGHVVIIAANQDSVFQRLCAAMETPELASDPRFSTHVNRGVHQDLIEGIVAEWAGRLDCATLLDRLSAGGVPGGKVYTIADIFADPLFRERDMLIEVKEETLGEVTVPGIVPKLSRTPGSITWAGASTLGTHNDEVFGEILGVAEAELAELRKAKII